MPQDAVRCHEMSERVQWVEDLTTGVDRWMKEEERRKKVFAGDEAAA